MSALVLLFATACTAAGTTAVSSLEATSIAGTGVDSPSTPHEPEAGDEILWGCWHRVPFDPTVGSTLRRALAYQDVGELEDAIAALNLGLDRTPRSGALFEARAALYARLGFQRAAERDFEVAVRLVPERGEAWLALGKMRTVLGLPRAALTALAEARRLGIDAPELPLAQARAFRQLGLSGDAAASYARALRDLPWVDPKLSLEAAGFAVEVEGASCEAWSRAQERLGAEATRAEVEDLVEATRELSSQDLEKLLAARSLSGEDLLGLAQLALCAVAVEEQEAPAEPWDEGEAVALGFETPPSPEVPDPTDR